MTTITVGQQSFFAATSLGQPVALVSSSEEQDVFATNLGTTQELDYLLECHDFGFGTNCEYSRAENLREYSETGELLYEVDFFLLPSEGNTPFSVKNLFSDLGDHWPEKGDIQNALVEGDVWRLWGLTLSGPDTLNGGPSNDIFFGLGGADLVQGNGDDDWLFGNSGNDFIYGNQGQDLLYGNQNNDLMFGGQGNDQLFGGQGDDLIEGNLGQDILIGNLGNDDLIGGSDADIFVFSPGGGSDTVWDFQDELDQIQVHETGVNLSQVDSDTLITLDSGDTILVVGISVEEVSDDLFLIA